MRRLWSVLAALASLSLTNCGYNAIQTNDEQVKSAWSEVLNQYQRRADLVPNLVNSVKDYNVGIRTFPNNLTAMMFGYKEKANFTVDNEKEISTAPKVDFNPAPAALAK